MSAYIVSNDTMNKIIYNLFWDHKFKQTHFILERHGYNAPEDFTRLGNELYAMNRESVKQRYDESEDSEYIKIPTWTDKHWQEGRTNKYEALKAMHCLSYQSCEGDVPQLPIYKFLEELIHSWESYIINAIPEYDAASGWS